MDCLSCHNKACKKLGRDCNGDRVAALEHYAAGDTAQAYEQADHLVREGRAGTLARIEEIALYCRLREWRSLALAYCYSMEDLARRAKLFFQEQGLEVLSWRCTLGGIRESDIVPGLRDSVNCNPIGQALAINRSKADLVVEMGLCLGHDILFHRHLRKPLTVLLVKDRVHGNCPQRALEQPPSGNKEHVP